jgi:TonB family protein
MRMFSQQSMNTSSGTPSERRSHARRNLTALTYVTIGDNNGGIISNISETGMALTAAEPILGKFVPRLVFEIPGINRTVEAQARIIWVAESKKAAGVHFIGMPDDVRTEIGNWVLARGFKGTLSNPSPSPTLRIPDKSPAPPSPAPPTAAPPSEQTNLRGSPARENRRPVDKEDDFDRMFPSENEPSTWRLAPAETAETPPKEGIGQGYENMASNIARDSRPYAHSPEVDPPSTQPPQPKPFPVFGFEQARPSKSNPDVTSEVEVRTWPPRLTPLPAVFQPAIDQSFSRMLESQATPFFADEPPASKMWLVAVAAAVCFMLGFAIQPGFLHGLPGMSDVHNRLFGSNSKPQSSDNNARSTSELPSTARTGSNTPADIQSEAGPGSPAPTTNKSTAPDAMQKQNTPSANTRGAAGESVASAPPVKSAPAPAKNWYSSQSAASTSELALAQRSRELREGIPATNPEMNSDVTPTTPVKSPDQPARNSSGSPVVAGPSAASTTPSNPPAAEASEPSSTNSLTAKPMMPSATTTPPATAIVPNTAQPATAPLAITRPPAVSSPSAALSTSPSTRTPVTASPPATTPPAITNTVPLSSSGTSASSSVTAPFTRAVVPTPRSTPPPSFFPVTAPGAGNVPRLMLLPEEKVIDTAMVKIHTHQFVFVPAQPGPEFSHQPERLQIGERISKVAPAYPAAAAQKGMGGTVQLRATISKDGTVENVKLLHGPELFVPAATDAVKQWRYRPTLLDRQPIELQEDFTIEFRPLGTQARE